MSENLSDIEDNNEIQGFEFSWKIFIPWISVVAIAIGQLNDTWEGVLKIWEFGQSTMTDQPSKNRLNRIYINASSGVLEENLGAPIYTKHAVNGSVITYYKDKRFILSAITQNDIVVAFLVFPRNDFVPNTSEHAGSSNYLEMSFDNAIDLTEAHSNVARMGNYYIEEISGGKFDLLYSSVGGVSEYQGLFSLDNMNTLISYNEKVILEEDTEETLSNLRAKFKPNFYGYTSIGIVELEQAILTYLEYELLTHKIG